MLTITIVAAAVSAIGIAFAATGEPNKEARRLTLEIIAAHKAAS